MNGFQRVIARLAVALWLVFLALSAHAAPGDLDQTFGTLGKSFVSFEGTNDSLNALAILPDGSIILAGSCSIQGDFDFCLAKLRANGVLESTPGVFGANGKATATVGSGNDFARAIAIQADGKIVLAGECAVSGGTNFCLARFNANGTIDNTFNGNGRVISSILGSGDSAFALAIQPDGKIVVAGQCISSGSTYGCMARYLTDGSRDNTFPNNNASFNNFMRFTSVRITSASDILATGYINANTTQQNLFVRRFDSSGTPHNNSSAVLGIDFASNSDTGGASAVQADDKLIVVGACISGSASEACASRVEFSGSSQSGVAFDTTFNADGKWIGSFVGAKANAVALQPDGRIVLGGACEIVNDAFCVLRLTPEGSLDASFAVAGAGYRTEAMGTGAAAVRAIAIDVQGRIVAGGECRDNPGAFKFCVMRVQGGPFGYQNCKLDLDGDGRVLATTDALMMTRISLGMTGNAVTSGITFPSGATRLGWAPIRNYLVSQCGMTLAP
jgi:uncharacterized delta-60 repeat protein